MEAEAEAEAEAETEEDEDEDEDEEAAAAAEAAEEAAAEEAAEEAEAEGADGISMVGMCLSPSSPRPVPMASSLLPQPFYPWASSLSDPNLDHLCAACFSSLPSPPPSSRASFACHGPCNGRIAYCSPACRDLDLPLHLSSGECSLLSFASSSASPVSDSCDLRLALRLLAFYEHLGVANHFLSSERRRGRSSSPEGRAHSSRLGGLMSNRSNLLFGGTTLQSTEIRSRQQDQEQAEEKATAIEGEGKEREEEVCEFAHELRLHVSLMYKARQASLSPASLSQSPSPSLSPKHGLQIERSLRSYSEEMVLLEEVICQVVTNGVHIPMDPLAMLIASSKDCSGASASTASSSSLQCSGYLGSAIYGPLFSWINHSCRPNAYYSFDLRYSSIAPTNADCDASLVPSLNITDQIEEAWGLRFTSQQVTSRYGPRLQLRAICDIQQLDPICVSYTDLLQPRNTRMRELWIKYRFECNCERCNMIPMGYADNSLENIGIPGCGRECLENELQDEFELGLDALMTRDDPHSCCKVLERALFKIIRERCKDCSHQKMPPLMHHSCLDIYMVLSSSYKILGARYGGLEDQRNACVNFSKENAKHVSPTVVSRLTSVGYGLVLAGCVQKFYDSGEVGLIDAVSRIWLDCGESIVRASMAIDRCFNIDAPLSECDKFKAGCLYHGGESIPSKKTLQADLNRFFGADTGHINNMDVHLDLPIVEALKKLVALIWPLFQGSSAILSSISAPCDTAEISSMVTLVSDPTGNPLTRESWLRHRVPVLLCAVCAFQHSSSLISICRGESEQCIKLFENMYNLIIFASQ